MDTNTHRTATAIEQIKEWARLAEAATEGPWEYLGKNVIDTPPIAIDEADWGPEGHAGYRIHTAQDSGAWRYADAALMAASRTAVPAMAAALQAVLERHHVQERCHDGDGTWSVTREDFDDAYDGEPEVFLVCRECGAIEMHESTEDGGDHSYLEALWPCATVVAITAALGATA